MVINIGNFIILMLCRTEKPPQRFAESSSPLVQGLEEPMAAAKEALDHAAAQLPTEDLSHSRSSAASPIPASSTSLAEPETANDMPAQEAAETLTQLAALTSEEAGASNQVQLLIPSMCKAMSLF